MARSLLAGLQRLPFPRPQSVVLGLLIAATLVMPVSYRAGSETSHAHSVFQGLIDLVVGHPHHHDAPATSEPVNPASTLFSPLPVSLAIAAPHVDDPGQDSDIPLIPGLMTPFTSDTAIQELRLLVLTILASVAVGRLWGQVRDLTGALPPVESPPPRAA